MELIEPITINDFDGKKSKISAYDSDNKKAIVTHFLHNYENGISKKLKKEALNCINQVVKQKYLDENIILEEASALQRLLFQVENVPFPTPENYTFEFIDLFAGIGGFRIALQNLGGRCAFTSEYDKMAQKTYFANFGEVPFGDITKEETKQWVPKKFDLLCGGFPCQPFSLAGVVKKNSLGRKHGFDDEKQGNLFFHIAEILERHRPKAFFLENVKNLVSHDKKNTFKIIKETLLDLGYSFHSKVLDGQYFVPQHRERIFMVGFDTKVFKNKEDFSFPEMPKKRNYNLPDIIYKNVDLKYTLSDKLWNYLQQYAKQHKEKGNGFGYGIIDRSDAQAVTRTMSARYYKDGAEILVAQKNKNPRRLTPEECAFLQGYPENFLMPVSDNQKYKQLGNSVVVPLIQAIGKNIVEVINKSK